MTDPTPSLAKLHVLLVDDDEWVRDVATSMLERAGARVTRCGTVLRRWTLSRRPGRTSS